MQRIEFYGVRDPYGEFSNFASYAIELDGLTWPTSEHYFQAQKFAGAPRAEAIRLVKSPTVAARMGRSRQFPLREDWDQVKDEVMRQAVWAKFSQWQNLRDLLLSTGQATLIEHTPRDAYWGDGGDGRGLNRLGEILMEVRTALRQETAE